MYNPEYLEKIKKEYNLDIVQAPINIVDRRFLSANVKKIIKKKNLLLQARSIFLQGTLLNSDKTMKFFRLKKKIFFLIIIIGVLIMILKKELDVSIL